MRWMLGVTTLMLLAGAGFAWNGGDPGIAGLLARVGAVFAASWIAHPALVKVDRRTIWLLVVGGLVVLVRPLLLFRFHGIFFHKHALFFLQMRALS